MPETSRHRPHAQFSWVSIMFGAALAVLLLVFFLLGALADRLFVVRPINFFAKIFPELATEKSLEGVGQEGETSRLGDVIRSFNTTGSVADVVEVAGKSVVTVSVKTTQPVYTQQNVLPGFSISVPNGQVQEVQRDIGTGFVVGTNNGTFVVTNRHVVSAPNTEYRIIDVDNNEYAVTNIYRDPVSDLAILKAENLPLPALPLGNSDKARVGDSVIAIGTALGEFRNTVTTGVISGIGRSIEASAGLGTDAEVLENVIQTDAAINPGNSGGPLINFAGEVIGVNVAVTQGAQSIGFAIPINAVKSVVDNFNETGQFERPRLGVTYEMVTARVALLNSWPRGAYITEVAPGSAAAKAGIKPDDIITKIDSESIQDKRLAEVINGKKVGQVVTLEVWRKTGEQEETLTLEATLDSATSVLQ